MRATVAWTIARDRPSRYGERGERETGHRATGTLRTTKILHPDRLKKRWEFQRAYQKGRKYLNRYFVIYVCARLQNTPGSGARLGITASKKVGKSVQRNRVKRLIREAFRALRPRIHPHYDVVVVGRTAACTLTCQEAQRGLSSLFRRAAILKCEGRR